MIEFYLNKIKKRIALDENQVVILKTILDEFYHEAIRSDERTNAWMEGYREGREHTDNMDTTFYDGNGKQINV